jgi:leucyl aminopeptidase
MKLTRLAAALLGLAAFSSSTLAGTTWITVGERAHALLAEVAPTARTLSSRDVAVTLPQQNKSRGARLALKSGVERVHAVEIDEEALSGLAEAVHERLRRCGGFVRHDSEAEARAALHRLQGQPGADLAIVPSYAIDNQAAVNALLPQMQASNILATIEQMAAFQNRRYNSSHGVNASNWLFQQWSQFAANRRDIRVKQITHTGFNQKSVMLEFMGVGNGGQAVVLGGHLDSIASGSAETSRAPGADDDASGIASLTEVIRVLVANNFKPRRTVRFYGYAGEEGGLLGSKQIVAAMANERVQVVGVMQLDMTAYQGSATDLWIYTDYTNAAQNQFVANLAATYLPTLTVGYDACGYGCSDHASWHNAGFAASLPFESADATYNPFIHTVNDTIATFGGTANHALKFSKLAAAFAVELGSD